MGNRTDFHRSQAAVRAADEHLAAQGQRALGTTQKAVLDALIRQGGYPGAWQWGTRSETVKVLETLVNKGLVTKEQQPQSYTSYTLSDTMKGLVK